LEYYDVCPEFIYLLKIKILRKLLTIVSIILVVSFTVSCSEDKDYSAVETSPVVLDLTLVPYAKLSDYHFFDGPMKDQAPSFGVIPFKPASELFSDYAHKKRFVWLPDNTVGTYNGDGNILELPVGAALIKTFYYDNVQPANNTRLIETRLMIRKQTEWILVKYVWNDEQTEAFLQTETETVPITWVDADNVTRSVDYVIPSENNCVSCHNTDGEIFPIGVKPQNLNTNFNYGNETKNQLAKLTEFGYLQNVPSTINSVIDYNDPSQSLDLRARSYFDSNCAHCHKDGGNASYVPMRFAYSETGVVENLGICVSTTTQVPGISHGYIVKPNDISQSILYYTMNTNNNFRMPRLGRTVIHEEALTLIGSWINSLEDCEWLYVGLKIFPVDPEDLLKGGFHI
jgi:uncharacterized repeat protein (TIGR03806 family)